MDKRIKAIAVTGPTASGKSSLAIALAKALDGEIISCDSMQVYRGMDIGTAKATQAEREEVAHHMLDILDPTESFSAADYAVRAQGVAEEIAARGRVPIFCGGTGLYLEAVRTMRHGAPAPGDPAFRAQMQALAEAEGKEALHARLAAVDPESAAQIHPNNLPRVIRALEIFHVTGKPKSLSDREAATENPRLSLLNLTLLFHSRALLYRRIDERVEAMMREGLLDETRALLSKGKLLAGTTAAAAIGYKECIGAISGEMTEKDAAEALKNATHHYAKRQLTWFLAREHTPIYMDDGERERPRKEILAQAVLYAKQFLDTKE